MPSQNRQADLPLVLAITGASGAVYAVRLLEVLVAGGRRVHLLLSPSGAAVLAFGQSPARLTVLAVVATAAGFFINAANSGFYSIVAQSYPSQLRAGGTGFVIGAGRAGSALGPLFAGLLFEAGWSVALVSATMACGCLVAAASIGRLRPTAQSLM